MAMKVLMDSWGRDTLNRVLEYMPVRWAKLYTDGVFMCTHPWVEMFNVALGKYNPDVGDVVHLLDKYLLADAWYAIGRDVPTDDGKCFPFRFELDQTAKDPILRPNGAVHMELLLAIDYEKQEGITLGVADGGRFGIHFFAVGLLGDGWHENSATITHPVKWVHPDDILHKPF